MRQYFTLLTDIPLAEVEQLLAPGVNPRDAKEVLGKAIVSQYHGAPAAEAAAEAFRRRARGEDPEEIADVFLPRHLLDPDGSRSGPKLLVALGFESSNSNARRVIEQGGFTLGPDRHTITDPKAPVPISDGLIVRVGKRKIGKIRLG